jgi:hypothetical protein
VTHCPRCRKDVYPIQDMQSDRTMLDICPTCSAPIVPIVIAPTVAKASAPIAAPAIQRPSRTTDIPGLLRERTESLRMELADYEAKRSELAMLERMLLAADQHEPEVSSSATWITPRHLNGHH